MIQLTKRVLPTGLRAKLDSWHSRLLSDLEAGRAIPVSLAKNYRDPELKAEIRGETHDKCAYCESKVSHVYPGDVEHVIPKSRFPEQTLNYDNLTYACYECNNNKSDYYDPLEPLIHPYDDNPEAHLVAWGALIFRRPGDHKGLATEKILELNRPALLERRNERVESVKRLADTYGALPPGPLRTVLEGELRQEAEPNKEYSLVVRGYLSLVCGIQV